MKSIRRALRHEVLSASAGVLLGSVIALIANGLGGIVSARALPVADKGLLAMVLTIGPMVWVAASLGSNVAIRVALPEHAGRATLADYRGLTCRLSLLHAGLSLLLIGAAALWIPEFRPGPGFALISMALSVAVFFSSQSLEALHALGRSGRATQTDALGAAVTLCLIGVVALTGPAAELQVMVGCYLVGYLVRIGCSELQIRLSDLAGRHGTTAGRHELLTRGVPFLGFNVGQVIAFRADRYLVGPLGSPAELGLYSVAATPAEALRLPVTALGQVMMQRSAAARVTVATIGRICLLTAALTIPLAVTLFLLADDLVVWLFGDRYAGAGPVLQVMVLAEVIVCFFIVLSRISAGAGLTRSTGIATLLGASVGLACLFWWTPRYGAVGAAWASAVGYAVMLATSAPPLLLHLSRIPTTEYPADSGIDPVQPERTPESHG